MDYKEAAEYLDETLEKEAMRRIDKEGFNKIRASIGLKQSGKPLYSDKLNGVLSKAKKVTQDPDVLDNISAKLNRAFETSYINNPAAINNPSETLYKNFMRSKIKRSNIHRPATEGEIKNSLQSERLQKALVDNKASRVLKSIGDKTASEYLDELYLEKTAGFGTVLGYTVGGSVLPGAIGALIGNSQGNKLIEKRRYQNKEDLFAPLSDEEERIKKAKLLKGLKVGAGIGAGLGAINGIGASAALRKIKKEEEKAFEAFKNMDFGNMDFSSAT